MSTGPPLLGLSSLLDAAGGRAGGASVPSGHMRRFGPSVSLSSLDQSQHGATKPRSVVAQPCLACLAPGYLALEVWDEDGSGDDDDGDGVDDEEDAVWFV